MAQTPVPALTPGQALHLQIAASNPGSPPVPPSTTLPGSTPAAQTIPAQAQSGIPTSPATQSTISQNVQNTQSNPANTMDVPDPDQDFANSMTAALAAKNAQPLVDQHPIIEGIRSLLGPIGTAPLSGGILSLLEGRNPAQASAGASGGPIGPNSTVAPTQEDAAYNAAAVKFADDSRNLSPYNPNTPKILAQDQAALTAVGGNRTADIASQQAAGLATPGQSDAFIQDISQRRTIDQAAQNLQKAASETGPGKLQDLEVTVNGLVQAGKLPDLTSLGADGQAFMTAATNGKLSEWLTTAPPVVVDSIVQGLLKGTLSNAQLAAGQEQRDAKTFFRTPTGGVDTDRITKLDPDYPTLGTNATGGVPDVDVNQATKGLETGRQAQIGEAAGQTGQALSTVIPKEFQGLKLQPTIDALKDSNIPGADVVAKILQTYTTQPPKGFVPDDGKYAAAQAAVKQPGKHPGAQAYIEEYEAAKNANTNK